MKDKPIILSAPMVRALLDGAKRQHWFLLDPCHLIALRQAAGKGRVSGFIFHSDRIITDEDQDFALELCPHGQVCDRLYVREAWNFSHWGQDSEGHDQYMIDYVADGFRQILTAPPGWSPVIFKFNQNIPAKYMPRWASRQQMEVTSVRLERLQNITDQDAAECGMTMRPDGSGWVWPGSAREKAGVAARSARDAYRLGLGEIMGYETWIENPLAFALSFRLIDGSQSLGVA